MTKKCTSQKGLELHFNLQGDKYYSISATTNLLHNLPLLEFLSLVKISQNLSKLSINCNINPVEILVSLIPT